LWKTGSLATSSLFPLTRGITKHNVAQYKPPRATSPKPTVPVTNHGIDPLNAAELGGTHVATSG
jgi:hypothetical protein